MRKPEGYSCLALLLHSGMLVSQFFQGLRVQPEKVLDLLDIAATNRALNGLQSVEMKTGVDFSLPGDDMEMRWLVVFVNMDAQIARGGD